MFGFTLLRTIGGGGRRSRIFQKALGGRIVSFTPSLGVCAKNRRSSSEPVARRARRLAVERSVRPRTAALQDPRRSFGGRIQTVILMMQHALPAITSDWVAHAARKYRVPYWMVVHGALDPYGSSPTVVAKRRFGMALIGRRAARLADRVLVHHRARNARTAPLPMPATIPPSSHLPGGAA